MAIALEVHSLGALLCSLHCDASWTTLQLKEAIEVATDYCRPACTFTLSIGTRLLRDEERLDVQDGAVVSLVQHKLPFLSLFDFNDQKTLTSALRGYPSKGCPLLMQLAGKFAFDGSLPHWEDTESAYEAALESLREHLRREVYLYPRHVPMETEMLHWIPWREVAGVELSEIACVLALNAEFEWCGDSTGHVCSVVLLKTGRLLAIAAKVWEASNGLDYDSFVVSALRYVDSWAELAASLPQFVEAMSQPLSSSQTFTGEAIGPARFWIGDFEAGWRTGERLLQWCGTERFRDGGWARLTRNGVSTFADATIRAMPEIEKLRYSIGDARSYEAKWAKAAAKCKQESFAEALAAFKEELGEEFQEEDALKDRLRRLEEAAPAKGSSFSFEGMATVAMGRWLYRDLALGMGREDALYEEWQGAKG